MRRRKRQVVTKQKAKKVVVVLLFLLLSCVQCVPPPLAMPYHPLLIFHHPRGTIANRLGPTSAMNETIHARAWKGCGCTANEKKRWTPSLYYVFSTASVYPSLGIIQPYAFNNIFIDSSGTKTWRRKKKMEGGGPVKCVLTCWLITSSLFRSF